MTDRERMYEAKQRYVAARNSESRKAAVNLDENQLDALERLANIRHNFHSNIESYFHSESSADWKIFNEESDQSINHMLRESNLPTIDFPDISDIPTDVDYFELLDDSEREEWEDKAAKVQGHTGFSLWMEESDEYELFCTAMEEINNRIEDYLRKIDTEHNTSFAPSGFARLK